MDSESPLASVLKFIQNPRVLSPLLPYRKRAPRRSGVDWALTSSGCEKAADGMGGEIMLVEGLTPACKLGELSPLLVVIAPT